MKHTIILPLSGIVFLFNISVSNAQSGTVSAGGDASGANGSVNYSVGQICYTTSSSGSGSVSEGVQQPYEISIFNGLDKKDITINIAAYPNPSYDKILLNTGNALTEKLSYGMLTMDGKMLLQHRITASLTEISLQGIAEGIYFMKIFEDTKDIKVFKIVKNK